MEGGRQLRQKGSSIIRRWTSTGQRIYLTFDDGPDEEITRAVLDILAYYEASATFFIVGKNLAGNEKLVEEICARGHAVGLHSRDHRAISLLSKAERIRDLVALQSQLREIAGVSTQLFRPPFGEIQECTAAELHETLGITCVLWSIDSHDWRVERSSTMIVDAACTGLISGDIILLHDGIADAIDDRQSAQWLVQRRKMLEALPLILQKVVSSGFEPAALPLSPVVSGPR